MSSKNHLQFYPLTPERWPDFETLFGERGACGGCWCMWMRLPRSEFEKQKGDGNKQAMRALVAADTVPGILAYRHEQPVGWCSVAPREQFSYLARSRILKPIDERPVWSIVCFFIDKKYRRQGLTVQLLHAAIDHVRKQGGEILEGYPVEPKKSKMPDVFVWTGLSAAFKKAGFVECLRRSETRPIMRYYL